MQDPSYLANPAIDSTMAWKREGSTDILVSTLNIAEGNQDPSEIREDAVLIVVGTVHAEKFFVSPIGNYSPRLDMRFQNSKFQFQIAPPLDADFSPDFSTVISKLEALQDAVAKSQDRRYLIERSGKQRLLKFSSPLFEAKVVQNCIPGGMCNPDPFG